MEWVSWQEKTMEFQNEWRTIVHFLCLSTAWFTGLCFAQAKQLMVFLIWQNSKRSLLLCTTILTSLPSSHSHWQNFRRSLNILSYNSRKCLMSGCFHSTVLWRHCTALGSLLWPTRPNSDDKACVFNKSLKEFNFVTTLCMMADVIPILTFMSLAYFSFYGTLETLYRTWQPLVAYRVHGIPTQQWW